MTIPGPSWPYRLAHSRGCVPDQLGFLRRCVQSYGDVVNLSPSASRPTYLLNHPDDIGHVLHQHHLNYHKTRTMTGAEGRQRSGEGLLTGMGQPAITQKRLLQPLMIQLVTAQLGKMMTDCTKEMMARWQPGGCVDVSAEMAALTRRIMGRSLLSLDLETDAPELNSAIIARQRYIRQVYESPLAARCNRQFRHAADTIDHALYQFIAARRRDPSPPPDLLTLFIQARYTDGSAMTDKQVRDEALTITSTGYETVALALVWTLYLLAHHPEAQERLARETASTNFAEMVYSEAMRLYPPTWIFVRVAEKEDTLPSGAAIPAGSKLFLCPYVTQRDARFFPEPERFDPGRFEKPAHPRFAYFPFSAGPRVCLGQGFAMMEGVRVLSCIAQRFTWKPASSQTIVPRPGQFLFPRRAIRVRLKSNEDIAR